MQICNHIGAKKYNKYLCCRILFVLILRIAFLKLNLNNVRAAFCDANKHSEAALMKLFRFKVVGSYKELIVVEYFAKRRFNLYLY